jgi:hypothetical protein
MTQVTISLPDDLAQRAHEAGLLSDSGIRQALEGAIRRQAGERLRDMMRGMPREELTPEIEQMIADEVRAYRAERRRHQP